MMSASDLAVVVLTHNRRAELLRTLAYLLAVAETPSICVVDNGSNDGTAEMVARRFPSVQLIRLPQNLGAAGRNHGVLAVTARYIAFCDDDTWWAPGALHQACMLLDRTPGMAVVTARILVGPDEREDPVSRLMAASPLPDTLGIPGVTTVAGFMAGACVVRRQAFLAAGGYEPRLFLGGEERLLSLDLMAAGWHLGYAASLVLYHHPSPQRNVGFRRRLLLRNALWCAWLRRPLASALRETIGCLRASALAPGMLARALLGALRGLPWVLRQRRVIPGDVEARLRLLETGET